MPALLASGANSGFISTSEASTDSLHFRAEVTRCLPETISDDNQAGSTERVLDLEARNPDPTVIADLERENERLAKLLFETTTDFAMFRKKTEGDLGAALNAQRIQDERRFAKVVEAEIRDANERAKANLDECEDDLADAEARLNECEARIREIRREDDRADAESKARLDECGKREAKIRDDAEAKARLNECEAQCSREAEVAGDNSAELEKLKAEIIEANKRATTNLNVCEARIRDERLKATENRAGHLNALAQSVDEIRHRQSLTDREIQNLQDTSDENNNALAVLVSKYRRLQIHLERVTAAIKAGVSTCRSNVVLSIISSLVVTFLK